MKTKFALFALSFSLAFTAVEAIPVPTVTNVNANNALKAATSTNLPKNNEVVIRNGLSKLLPELKVDQVNPTAIDGMFEVVANKKIFYVDKTGRYIILGNLIDLATKQSLTEIRANEVNIIKWSELPLNYAIEHIVGNGKTKIAVFIDPECPFCKILEQETLSKLENVTIYYFLYPLPMHVNSLSYAQRILCSAMPFKSYSEWMKDGTELPKNQKCDRASHLPQIIDFAQKALAIDSTPTIILPSGHIIKGVITLDSLSHMLADESK